MIRSHSFIDMDARWSEISNLFTTFTLNAKYADNPQYEEVYKKAKSINIFMRHTAGSKEPSKFGGVDLGTDEEGYICSERLVDALNSQARALHQVSNNKNAY